MLSGVPYAALPGARPLELDLYLPPSDGRPSPAPVAVFLHGGGWRLGSRRSLGPAYARTVPPPFEQVARAGIAVASVDYRLSGERTWPAQLSDAKAAVRWLRSRGGEVGVDPDRIGAWGESAGAQLALLLGLTGADLDGDIGLDGDVGIVGPSSAVAAAAAWYPPTDLAALPGDLGTDPGAADTREALMIGAPLDSVPDRVREAGPITYLRVGVPPILLLHGRDDRLIPCVQSDRFAAAARAAGAAIEYETYPGADHMWLGSIDAPAAALVRTIQFLQAELGSQ